MIAALRRLASVAILSHEFVIATAWLTVCQSFNLRVTPANGNFLWFFSSKPLHQLLKFYIIPPFAISQAKTKGIHFCFLVIQGGMARCSGLQSKTRKPAISTNFDRN